MIPPPLSSARLLAFEEALSEQGLGPVGRLDAFRYDEVARAHGLPPLPSFGSPHRLGLVVASSKSSWPPFLEALRGDPSLRDAEHPFDTWARRCIEEAAQSLERPTAFRYPWEDGPRRVAFVRLAALAGLGSVGPTGLLVHPEHGPWLGLRGVVLVDAEPQVPVSSRAASGPCEGCPAPCEDALQAASTAMGDGPAWRRWLAVRESCPVGRAARYGATQIRYHYTKERDVLRMASRAPSGEG